MGRFPARSVLAALSAAALLAGLSLPTAGASDATTAPRAGSAVDAAVAVAGGTLWATRYDGPGHADDGATSVVISPDGSTVFTTGGSTGKTSDYDFTTLASDAATGARRWARRYNGPGNGYDQATAITLSPSGSKVFVTGASRGSGTALDFATVAYDAVSGAQLWVKRYSGTAKGVEYATAIGVSPDGSRLFVTGYSPGSGSGDDFATLAYRASSGVAVWTSRYNGPGHDSDEARALAVSPDGATVYVGGGSVGSTSGYDYATIAYRAGTGARKWVARYNGPGDSADLAHDIALSPTGGTVYVTGESIGKGGFDYGTVAYSAGTGARRWVARYNGTAGRDDYGTAVGVSPNGSTVFVTGYSVGSADRFDYATVAYSAATGVRAWVKRYNGPGDNTDNGNALAVSPDGSSVVVTGVSIASGGFTEYATVAYAAADGTQRWVARYSDPGSGNSYAYALVVNPASSAVFVTGESTASTGYLDMATLAYALK